MTSETKYNGWTNHETWLANLHFDCAFQDDAERAVQSAIDNDEEMDSAKESLAETIEASIQEVIDSETSKPSLFLQDVIGAFMRKIDFREIAYNYIDGLTIYSAGWNMPGYMPDSEPARFLDPESALEYVREEAMNNCSEAQESEIDAWKADKNGEFGAQLGDYFYFVQIV